MNYNRYFSFSALVLIGIGILINVHSYLSKLLTERGSLKIKYTFYFSFVLSYFLCNSCTVSLKSTGIPPTINTFFVEEYENNARNVVPTLSYDFTQALIDKVRNESRLNYVETDPDVVFSGFISRYQVTSVAPEENNGIATTAFNRLEMAVNVTYINHREDDPKNKEWSQQFSFFVDFESDQNLLDVQEALIEALNDQLVEDIFNKAFSGW